MFVRKNWRSDNWSTWNLTVKLEKWLQHIPGAPSEISFSEERTIRIS